MRSPCGCMGDGHKGGWSHVQLPRLDRHPVHSNRFRWHWTRKRPRTLLLLQQFRLLFIGPCYRESHRHAVHRLHTVGIQHRLSCRRQLPESSETKRKPLLLLKTKKLLQHATWPHGLLCRHHHQPPRADQVRPLGEGWCNTKRQHRRSRKPSNKKRHFCTGNILQP